MSAPCYAEQRCWRPSRVLMLATARARATCSTPSPCSGAYDRAGARPRWWRRCTTPTAADTATCCARDRAGYAEADKDLYVSPFFPVDGRYQIQLSEPGESVSFA